MYVYIVKHKPKKSKPRILYQPAQSLSGLCLCYILIRMLDDLKLIHERDGQDALGTVAKQWQQLTKTYPTPLKQLGSVSKIQNVVLAGMGGSALAATIVQSWPGTLVPFEIVRNYSIPSYVTSKTLFVASSYSGNTEETLAALAEAEAQKAVIVVIAAGGALAKIAADKKYPFFQIPEDLQPRMAVFYNLAALVQLFEEVDVVAKGSAAQLRSAAKWVSTQIDSWLPEVPASKNEAKQIAQELMGKSVVIYGSPAFFPAAYKWKINCNENAKNIAWCNVIPEFNHNEFLGWTSHPVQKPYAVVDLRSSLDHPQIQKRFIASAKLLSGKRPDPIVVEAQGQTLVGQLLWTIYLGDFVSLYLALLNGLNPTPVDLIEKLKKELS